jgi:23S rRNA (adenine2030-N6)-methyltransferase
MKHAILLDLIAAMRAKGPVRLIETHAGAGLYDLDGEIARRTGEAKAGVGRLMRAGELPAPLEALRQAVRAENMGEALRFYPGSPALALKALAAGDRYRGYELRSDDLETLQALLRVRAKRSGVDAVGIEADGYNALAGELRGGELVLIDPPYERGDDYDRVVEAARLCIARGAALAIWAPIKDLETLDGLTRRIEALFPRRFELAEVRLRPLSNPMKMNGSAMLLVDTPPIAADSLCTWVAEVCGEPGGVGRSRRLVD